MFESKIDVAKRLKVSVRTVENWMRRKVLPYLKIGKVVRFWDEGVLEALLKHTVQSRPDMVDGELKPGN